MKRPYILSKGAASDLREITRYTVAKWGAEQCRAYIAALEEKAGDLGMRARYLQDLQGHERRLAGAARCHQWQALRVLYAATGCARGDFGHLA